MKVYLLTMRLDGKLCLQLAKDPNNRNGVFPGCLRSVEDALSLFDQFDMAKNDEHLSVFKVNPVLLEADTDEGGEWLRPYIIGTPFDIRGRTGCLCMEGIFMEVSEKLMERKAVDVYMELYKTKMKSMEF